MNRKQGLVPIGEAFGGRAVRLKAIREASPQTRHHFTQADQVDQLVSASEADPDLGFMARTMALCSLPRTNPGNQLQYKRVNGPYKLAMIAGTDNKLPYGNLPRLLLAWVCTEAVRTQSRVLILGDSVSEFMRKLDIYSTSGEKYTHLNCGAFLTHRVGLDARIGAAFGSKADVVLRFRFVDTDLPQVKRRIENRSIDLNELHSKATWSKHTY